MNEENGMGKPAASEEAKQEADELAKAVADKVRTMPRCQTSLYVVGGCSFVVGACYAAILPLMGALSSSV